MSLPKRIKVRSTKTGNVAYANKVDKPKAPRRNIRRTV